MKELIILGVTGSIGKQVLETIKGKDFRVRSIACGKRVELIGNIISEYNLDLEYLSVSDENLTDDAYLKIKDLQKKYPNLKIGFGESGLIKAIVDYPGDVVNAITGIAGLIPTVKAIECKKNVMLANKETLVVAGNIILEMAKNNNVRIVPIDSEHNALYRLMNNVKEKEISKLIITASGGAFRDKSRDELANVTIDDALAHPNWSMGAKITVDCATMVNKGLEVMEAHHLFNFDYDNIETVIHPESIIHSMVEYNDNSVGALMYNPSMLIPIQYAIYEDNLEYTIDKTDVKKISFTELKQLTFREMDEERFPMIRLAYEVGKAGGLLPTVFNASNEAAVSLFLNKKIKFLQIEEIIKNACLKYRDINKKKPKFTIEDIINLDKEVKANILF